ncbi:MAG: two-component regulator propeller domain-containing protein [Imperialibacter sp.]|uniref:hybrid sensor histidine kinase/response regulator transcription factor n=1 Tax=Imperialibacter sp. TaxID=2038411 RepID=UPI0032EDD174
MKPFYLLSLFFGICSLLPLAVLGQGKNESFSSLSVEQGLSSVTISAIHKDSKGYLWVGTEDGLNRYNGYEFKIYRNDPSDEYTLLTNRVLSIFEDSRGTLWVSTAKGTLHRYNRELDTFIRIPEFNNLVINDIREDSEQRVWFVGTTIKSLYLPDNSWTDHTNNFKGRLSIIGIEQIHKSDFWIAADTALYRWNRKTGNLKVYAHDPKDPNSLGYNYLYSIAKDDSGNLWIATRGGGLDKFDVQSSRFTHYRTSETRENGPLVNVVRTVCPDGNYIWAGTENGGLSRLDIRTTKFEHHVADKDYPKSISDNSIKALYKDNEGRLWIGTFSFGLSVIDPYQNKFTSFKAAYQNTVVNALYKDSKGRFWIGTEGGIMKLHKGNTSYYLNDPIESGQNGIPVLAIYEDRDHNIWVGTWAEGVFVFNETTQNFDRYATAGNSSQDLSNQNVYAVRQDRQSANILMGTYYGLNLLSSKDQNSFTHIVDSTWAEDASINNLRIIFEDKHFNTWIGTNSGLKLYNSEKVKMEPVFSESENYSENILSVIFCLFEDSKGRLWAGTESGLYHLKSKDTFERYTIDNGLTNHNIKGILEDSQGHLWISTSNGMSVFDPENETFKNYDDSDGLLVNGFKGNSSFKDADGLLYFGGSNGIITFNPSEILDNPHPPLVVLEDFKVFNKSVSVNSEDSILTRHISETKELSLESDFNIFSIEYAALNMSASDKNQYAYRLIGFDDKWNFVGETRSTTYTNLDPGRYVFEVKASNNDGVWNNDPTRLTITVLPAWWETSWAYLGYITIVISLLYLFRRITLIRAHFINDLRLERLKLESVERLNKTKLQFFTNISHEFRTPLTLIIGPIQNLIDSEGIEKGVKGKLQSVNHNVLRLHKLVNQLLDFRKVESGNMKVTAMESNLVSFIKEIKYSFDTLAEEMNADFTLQSSHEEIMVWFDPDQMEKVIFNLLSNAFKKIPKKGVVSIKLEQTTDNVYVSVFDNGTGIKREHLTTIFEPFFSYDEGKHSTGTGIGLSLSKSLIELHHGSIGVESIEGQFARFTLTLPLGNIHFKPTEVVEGKIEVPVASPRGSNVLGPPVVTLPEPVQHSDDTPTVLIVEDNREVSAYIQSILEKDFKIQIAFNGKEGLEKALKTNPNLVISDLMMPVMDGIALCNALRQTEATSHIPIILLTARTSEVYKIEGLETGADDYITKPFNSKVLALKVRNLLDGRKKLMEMFADNKTLTLEPTSITVTSRDEIFINQALKSVESNISNTNYSVDDLCKDVGMSKATLFRKLKALTGQSANEVIRTIRLKRAAQILAEGDFSISEVAYMVGFNDPKYFRNCFKKVFSQSPSEYADQMKTGESKDIAS